MNVPHIDPRSGENRIWEEKDLVKVDYGVHANGCIIDSPSQKVIQMIMMNFYR